MDEGGGVDTAGDNCSKGGLALADEVSNGAAWGRGAKGWVGT